MQNGTRAASQAFAGMGRDAQAAMQAANRSASDLAGGLGRIAAGAAGIAIITGAVHELTQAITAIPGQAFDYSKQLEASSVGMAGVLGSMTAINGKQLDFHRGLAISQDMIRKLNDDALRTAASSQELVGTFQALLAPGLAAGMKLDEIRQLAVVGTNAVKSIGLQGHQIVQEMRDLVQGGITAAGSSLATALGLKDEDIASAKASSEGLFAFLMQRLKGFEASSQAFGDTLQGRLDSLKEGAVRVAAEGMAPLTTATGKALEAVGKLLMSKDDLGNIQLNPQLTEQIAQASEKLIKVGEAAGSSIGWLYQHREALMALWTAYKAFTIAQWTTEALAAVQAKREMAAASTLAAVQAAAEGQANQAAALTAREKIAAVLAEVQARVASTQAEAADAAAKVENLRATQAGILAAREQALATLQSVQASIAQAESMLAASRAAGAQSYALAVASEATTALTAAQARQSAGIADLAMLGRQQAAVAAGITAATAAQTAATGAATAAMGQLTAAKAAASMAGRAFGAVMGALGGPVGIAIMAVAGLVLWLNKLKAASEEASMTAMRIQRANAAAARGEKAEDRDLMAMRAELENRKDKRDKLLADGVTSSSEWIGGAKWTTTLDGVNADIASLTAQLKKAEGAGQQAAGANQNLTLTVAGTAQAYNKAIDGIKTAGSVQEEYTRKLNASRQAARTYSEQLRATGDTKGLAQLNTQQVEVEKALARDRDKALKNLSGGAGAQRAANEAAQMAMRDALANLEKYQEAARGIAERQLRAAQALHQAGLIDDKQCVQAKFDLAKEDLANQEAIVELEIAAVEKSKAPPKDKQTQIIKFQQELAKLRERGVRDAEDYENALLVIEAQKAQKRAELRRQEAEGIAAHMEQLAAARRQALASVQTRIDSLRDEGEAAQISRAKNITLAEAIEQVAIARMRERQQAKFLPGGDEWKALDEEIKKREELLGQLRKNALEARERDGMAEAWRSMDDAARRAFDSVLANGQGAFEGLVKSGKAALADLAYQFAIRPIIMKIGTSIFGDQFSLAAQAAMGSQASGSLWSSVLGLGSNYGSSAASTLGGWLGYGQSAGAGLGTMTYANTVGMMGGDGLGALISSNAGWGGVSAAGGSAAALTSGNTALGMNLGLTAAEASAAATAASAAGASTAAAGGTAAGVAAGASWVPVVGWIVAALALLSADSGPTPHRGAASVATEQGVNTVKPNEIKAYFDQVDDKAQQALNGLTGAAVNLLNAAGQMSGAGAGFKISTAYAADGKDASSGVFDLSKNGKSLRNWESTRQDGMVGARDFSVDGYQEYLNQYAREVIDTLKAMDLPAPIRRMIDEFEQAPSVEKFVAISETVSQIPAKMQAAFGISTADLTKVYTDGLLSGDVEKAGQATADAWAASVERTMVGGAAAQIMQTVQNGIFMPILLAAQTNASVSQALSDAAIAETLEKAKAQAAAFKAIWGNEVFQTVLREVRDTVASVTTEAGKAMGFTPTYQPPDASAQKAADKAADKAAEDAQRAAEERAKRIADERKSLEDRLAAATLTRIELLGRERAKIDASNQALYDEVVQAEERKGLLDQLRGLTDTNAQALARQREAIQGSNLALFDQVQLLGQLKRIQEAANQAVGRYVSPQAEQARQLEQMAAQVQAPLAAAGFALSLADVVHVMRTASKVELREFAESLNLSSQAGRDAAEAVLGVAGSLADLREQAVDAALQGVQRAAEAQKSAITEAAQARQTAIEQQLETLQAADEAARDAQQSAKAVFDALKGGVRSLRQVVDKEMDYRAATLALERALASARAGGYLPDAEQVSEWVGSITARLASDEAAHQVYASQLDANRERLAQAARMEALQGIAGGRASVAQQQLDATKAQGAALKAQQKTLEESARAQIAAIDEQTKLAQQAVDALRGQDVSLRTLNETMLGLREAMIAAATGRAPNPAAPAIASTGTAYAAANVNAAADFVARAAAAGDARAILVGAQANKLNASDVAELAKRAGLDWTTEQVRAAAASMGVPGFAAGGLHAGGVRLVGEYGPELEITGPARYWSASQTESMLRGAASGGASDSGDSILVIHHDLSRVERSINAMLSRIAEASESTAKMLKRWDAGGMPQARPQPAEVRV
ncbi:MAG TPA: hypothetical protein PKD73_06080 [Burkholderiaceae bacterium]|nr:hypothetical protein [Burkholderiaceae bacterium]